jgi:hypothetical protein
MGYHCRRASASLKKVNARDNIKLDRSRDTKLAFLALRHFELRDLLTTFHQPHATATPADILDLGNSRVLFRSPVSAQGFATVYGRRISGDSRLCACLVKKHLLKQGPFRRHHGTTSAIAAAVYAASKLYFSSTICEHGKPSLQHPSAQATANRLSTATTAKLPVSICQ